MLAVRTNNLFLALLVKIKVLVAYAVSKNYVVIILLIILSYTVYSHSNVTKNDVRYWYNDSCFLIFFNGRGNGREQEVCFLNSTNIAIHTQLTHYSYCKNV